MTVPSVRQRSVHEHKCSLEVGVQTKDRSVAPARKNSRRPSHSAELERASGQPAIGVMRTRSF